MLTELEINTLRQEHPEHDWSSKSFIENLMIFDTPEELYDTLFILPNNDTVVIIKSKNKENNFALKYIYVNASLTISEVNCIQKMESLSQSVGEITTQLERKDTEIYSSIETYATEHIKKHAASNIIQNYIYKTAHNEMDKKDILEYMYQVNPSAFRLKTGRILHF